MPAAPPLECHLLAIAKSPVAGRVKTRLAPALGPHGAARLAEAALRDTVDAICAAPVARRTLALDGAAPPWLPGGVTVTGQTGAGLAERLAAAFGAAFELGPEPVLLVGMDTPQVSPGLLARCGTDLLAEGTDAVLGLACDGGFWSLGLRRPDPALLLGVPMSRPDTGAEQLARLRAAGLRTVLLPRLRDVDLPTDLAPVARVAPGTRFAAFLAADGAAGDREAVA